MPQAHDPIRQQIRQQMRAMRLALSDEVQTRAANHIREKFTALPVFDGSTNIALYLPMKGEISTLPIIESCWAHGKSVYLPLVHPFTRGHLLFQRYMPETPLDIHDYGMQEPKLDVREILPLHQLDVICTPLVAFDQKGQRLGMGGGFYDRTLACIPRGSKIQVLGLAHDCQGMTRLPSASWDVPLPFILTPTKLWAW